MTAHDQRSNGQRSGTRHAVQLFDTAESRDAAVAAFLHEGLVAGDTLLVVHASEHWNAIEHLLRTRASTLEPVLAEQRLVVRDAAATLSLLLRRGMPDEALFDASVGALVRQLASRAAPLRIYGEMVGMLAERGEFRDAARLEQFWSRLSAREPFNLLCGYSSVSFGNPRTAGALRSICEAHSHVVAAQTDLLGAFLLDACGAHPPATRADRAAP